MTELYPLKTAIFVSAIPNSRRGPLDHQLTFYAFSTTHRAQSLPSAFHLHFPLYPSLASAQAIARLCRPVF